jgi:hypothetical protein
MHCPRYPSIAIQLTDIAIIDEQRAGIDVRCIRFG